MMNDILGIANMTGLLLSIVALFQGIWKHDKMEIGIACAGIVWFATHVIYLLVVFVRLNSPAIK